MTATHEGALVLVIGLLAFCAEPSAAQSPASAPLRPAVVGLSHLTLQVTDLAAARAYYHGLLGFEEACTVAREPGEPEHAYFTINRHQHIELVGGLGADGDDRRAHLGYEVTDVAAMRTYLARMGVTVPASVGKDRLGNLTFSVRDNESREVEFVQYVPDSPCWRASGRPPSVRQMSVRAFHAAIPVTDLDGTIRFYHDVLGFSEMLKASEQNPVWINYRLPEAAVYIEWTLMPAGTSGPERAKKYHLGLAVPDIQAAAEDLRDRASAQGVPLPPAIVLGKNRRWHLGVVDPDNRRHELMEPYTVK
jgi:catechol 2,3-dioxygenase-like lactoylglutathione lyase family enzyme